MFFLASESSLDSPTCRAEIARAERDGKPLIVALLGEVAVEDPRLRRLRSRQMVSLGRPPQTWTAQSDEAAGVSFNVAELGKIGNGPTRHSICNDAFPWSPDESTELAGPYPGLTGYGPENAGIFFGRDAEIARGLAPRRKPTVQPRRTGKRGAPGSDWSSRVC